MNAVYWRVSRAGQPTLSCTETMGSSMRCMLRSRTPVTREPSPSTCQCRPELASGFSPALTSARTHSGVTVSPGLSWTGNNRFSGWPNDDAAWGRPTPRLQAGADIMRRASTRTLCGGSAPRGS